MSTSYFTQDFRKHLKKLTRRDSTLRNRVLSKIEDMMDNPYRNSEELVGDFKGKRRMYVGKAAYRLIYSICEECRKKNYQKFNSCFDCNDRDHASVIFIDIMPRSRDYRKY